jgi:hypothetical protein
MRATLRVPQKMAGPLRTFLADRRIPLRVTIAGDGALRVACSARRRRSTPAVLYLGGWITCAVARGLADKLGIKTRQVGALLNRLDIKVRACDLGCFK